MALDFRVLGPLEICRDGVATPLGPAMQRSLLAALLLEPNRVVPTDRLMSTIWDGEPPRSAVANIRTYTSRLRAILTDGRDGTRLSGRSPGYSVTVREGELDVNVFDRLTRFGRSAMAAGRLERAAQLFGEALALWRGSAAEDVRRTTMLDRRLAALDECRLATTEDWLDARQRLGEGAQLIDILRRLTVENPLRERMWGQLMIALYLAGDAGGALAAFHQARQALVENVGIEPGPELAALQRAVLTRDPALSRRGRSTSSGEQATGGTGDRAGLGREAGIETDSARRTITSTVRLTVQLEVASVDLAATTERLALVFGDLAIRPALRISPIAGLAVSRSGEKRQTS